MPLTVRVVSFQRLSPDQQPTRTLVSGTLTIGRGDDNDWVLPDPARIVSKHHCTIHENDSCFELVDHSANGVSVNNGADRLPKGQPIEISHGDKFRLGDYEIEASVEGEDATPSAEPVAADIAMIGDDFHGDPMAHNSRPEPAANQKPSGVRPSGPPDGVISALVKAPPREPERRDEPLGSHPDHLEAYRDFFSPPELKQDENVAIPAGVFETKPAQPRQDPVGDLIPEHWDEDGASQSPTISDDVFVAPATDVPIPGTYRADADVNAQEVYSADEPPVDTAITETAEPEVSPASPSRTVGVDPFSSFLQGAGLSDLNFDPEQAAQILYEQGQLFHHTIQGLMEILAARAETKGAFAIERTMIRPTDNNPMKFLASADEAKRRLLESEGDGFMKPLDAVAEALDDVKAHQLATLAGMRKALEALLSRFDPAKLENRLSTDGIRGVLLKDRNKSRYWDAFCELYGEIAGEAEEDFHQLFGREFAKAYQQELLRRKS